MPFYVIAYEKRTYMYHVVEAENWEDAYQRVKKPRNIIHFANDVHKIERADGYDSGPWKSLEKAQVAIDQGWHHECAAARVQP